MIKVKCMGRELLRLSVPCMGAVFVHSRLTDKGTHRWNSSEGANGRGAIEATTREAILEKTPL